MIDVKNNKVLIKKVGTKGWEYGKLYAKEFFTKYSVLDILFPIIFGVVVLRILETYGIIIKQYIFIRCIYPFPMLFWASVVLLICYLGVLILRHQLWKLVLLRTINFYDKYLIISLMICIMNGTFYLVMGSELWNIYFWCALFCLLFVSVKIQMYRLGKNAAVAKKPNIITLNDLYYNHVPKKDLILLDESAILTKEEDLLMIMPFVIFMHELLLKISARRTHVIGLTGKWGCGKTSIMNLLQQEMQLRDDIVIAMFSPWQYEDTYNLFKGFSDFVFKHFDDTFGYMNYKEYFRKYQNMLFGYMNNKQGLSFEQFFGDKSTDITQMREIITEKIKSEDKKMIIVIDDIDRLHKTEILFIFKVIQTIFNFDHLVYILNFDEERINKVFKEEFATDKNYLDKIIQTKINVPQIDPKAMQEIGKTSILNILRYHGVAIFDPKRLEQTIEVILQNFHDLRDLIRYLNSVSATIKNIVNLRLGLDISDVIALEYIKYADLGLYYQFANNSCFFISEGVEHSEACDINTLLFMQEDNFNEQGRTALNQMFVGKEHLIEVLSMVFPNIKAYKQGGAMSSKDSDIYSEDVKPSFLMQRCYTGSFFDVYFTGRGNAFTRLNKIVEHFIDEMNFINVDLSKQIQLNNILDLVGKQYQRLLLKVIKSRIDEIADLDKLFSLAINIPDLYEQYEVTSLLLAAIIKKEQENPQKYIIGLADTDLRMLERVLSELDLKIDDGRMIYGRTLLNTKLAQKEEEKYDPFNKEEYKRGAGRLYSSPHYDGDKTKTAKRLSALVNQENIFRVIAEYVQILMDADGTKHGYYYDLISAKIIDIKTIDKTLKHGFYELNADQVKIKEIYEAHGDVVLFKEDIDFSNL